MGKQSSNKLKKSYGTGKITPVQIAFLVDRYLSDEGYSETRSLFRSEASVHFAKSPVQEAPKKLLSLAEILDEYINLKGQKVALDQEKARLEHEKYRVQTLLQGMQEAMNNYNVVGNGKIPLQQSLVSAVTAKTPPTSFASSLTAKSAAVAPQMDLAMGSSPAGYHMHSAPLMMPTARPFTTPIGQSHLSTPVTNNSSLKRRKDSKDAPVNAKRSRSSSNRIHLPVKGTDNISQLANSVNNHEKPPQSCVGQSSPNDTSSKETAPAQGSSIAKCLFNKSTPSPPNHTSPKTPNRASSSHTDKSVSPLQTSSTATSGDNVTPQQTTSTNCIVISSETIRVSPVKQVTYYSVERNQCISSSSPIKSNLTILNKRDHVKGRLNFDASDTKLNKGNWVSNEITIPESDKEIDIFDIDLPNLDVLGVDFSFSDLLGDFNPDGDFGGQPEVDSSPGSNSGSPGDAWNTELGDDQIFTKLSSTVTEIFSEKDMNVQGNRGQQAVTSLRSRTQSINIISPVKSNGRSYSYQENKEVTY